MGWTPPTEDEFNEWYTVDDVLTSSGHRVEGYTEKRSIVEQLRAGRILAVARDAQVDRPGPPIQRFVRVSTSAWQRMKYDDESHFWETGQLIVSAGECNDYGEPLESMERYFDVRFDPHSFTGKPQPSFGDDAPPAKAQVQLARVKEISKDDAERMSRAILAGWPDATEKFAHEKALAFFPHNKVPREWFLGIFRVIRGPKNRGSPPKIRG